MTNDKTKHDSQDDLREASRTERHPRVPDDAVKHGTTAVPGGNRPDAAVAEDPDKPGMIDKSKT